MHLHVKLLFFVLFALTSCESAKSQPNKLIPYTLTAPSERLELPDTLREISGITYLSDSTIACIQDENGIVFIYNFQQKTIQNQFSFHLDGDYEGIAKVDQTLYILRSDGMLFEIKNYLSSNFKMDAFATGIPIANNEGLCYDAKNDRLLIGCKSKLGKGPEFKNLRVLYAFDLKTKKLGEKPLYEFNVEQIKHLAKKNNLELPVKTNKKGEVEPVIKFTTSEVAIHPISKHVYLLSSTDPMLFIFDSEGKLVTLELLDANLFNKAEGITFLPNGDMLISNEGQQHKPTLLRFKMMQK